MTDVDQAYDNKHGSQEQPWVFRVRFLSDRLTDEEKAKVEHVSEPEEAFAILYPDFVSRHAFRELRARELAEAQTPLQPDADVPLMADEDPVSHVD
jgi:hypothetical protein